METRPIAYLMVVQFLETHVHPLLLPELLVTREFLGYLKRGMHDTSTEHLNTQTSDSTQAKHLICSGKSFFIAITYLDLVPCETKTTWAKQKSKSHPSSLPQLEHKVRSPSFTWTKNQFSLQ